MHLIGRNKTGNLVLMRIEMLVVHVLHSKMVNNLRNALMFWKIALIVFIEPNLAKDAFTVFMRDVRDERLRETAGLYRQTVISDTIACTGTHRYHATGTAYYPDPSPVEGGYVDMHGMPLQTLQDYLEGKASVVTVAIMDNHAGISYDTPVCIPELNQKYNRFIDFRVRDTGSAFTNKGHSRIDICVRTRHDSFDNTINGPLTLVFH
ncbi:uncharacterized protein LOC127839292 isoform X1 [Dreissena polymorpha]|uniref:uncharacterized protein LOC127839292 isoform X1 n=1 Tax=Dreissena polymorpha TaxID=45954 RepID=UPI0022654F47|nr:uncharacterized protein LOC127839292 isoform X1 [Dreissena polymorpha]